MRLQKVGVLAATSLCAVFGPTASAQAPDPTLSDLKCMLSSAALVSQTTDAQQQSALQAAALYYIGVIDGRTPNLDLVSFVEANRAELESMNLGAEAIRCGAHLVTRGNVLQEAGEVLRRNESAHKP